jgi:hypothetical protein
MAALDYDSTKLLEGDDYTELGLDPLFLILCNPAKHKAAMSIVHPM